MNKLSLSSEDFVNKRLNKSFFTNINKGISVMEFRTQYPTKQFDTFEKGIVESYIKDVYEITGGEIVKGGFNDTPEIAQIIENAKNQVSLLKGVLIEDEFGAREIYVLEKGKESKELNKGRIHDTLHYSDLNIKFTKTGKEIKSKLSDVKKAEDANCLDLRAKMNTILEKIPFDPTEGHNGDCGVKTFPWDMTYDGEKTLGSVSYNDTESGTLSSEQTKLCRGYNDLAYSYRESKRELDAINLLEENLDDNKKFELTAGQMLMFGF